MHRRDEYHIHPFECGEPLQLDGPRLEVMPTPGHTRDSVSLRVETPGRVEFFVLYQVPFFVLRADLDQGATVS